MKDKLNFLYYTRFNRFVNVENKVCNLGKIINPPSLVRF